MARKHRNHWRALVGALAVAGLAFGLSLRLEGAAHVPGGLGKSGVRNIAVTAEESKRADRMERAQLQASTGEPVVYGNLADLKSGNVPTFPTIVVDYRDDNATRMRDAGLLAGPLPLSSEAGAVATGHCPGIIKECTYGLDCDDGNPCTRDTCDFQAGGTAFSGCCENVFGSSNIGDAQCPNQFGLACGACDDGLYCNGVEVCCTGVATPAACCTGPGTGTCPGPRTGCAPGTPPCGVLVCSETISVTTCENNRSQACVNDGDCTGATCNRYSCQDNGCSSAADCHNANIVGAAFKGTADLTCNGTETCNGGICVAGENPCGSGAICGEKQCSGGPEVNICLTDEDCFPGPATTVSGTCSLKGPVCKPGRCCIGSVEPSCTRRLKRGVCCKAGNSNAQCNAGVGYTPGTNDGAPCMSNAECDSGYCPLASVNGINNSCDGLGGNFYGGDDGFVDGNNTSCPIVDDVQVKCPKYGSGIVPRGPFPQLLGPISNSSIAVQPFNVALQKLGDDYALSNPGVCVGGGTTPPGREGLGCAVNADCPNGGTCNLAGVSYFAMDYLRFAGGSPATDRISFEFYDEFGNFIEDLFFSGSAAFGIYPVLFDPAFEIPSRGFVVMRVATEFSPDARHVWATTTGPADVGTNNPNKMYVNGGIVNSNFGTTGTLAFEIEGKKIVGSYGACCYTNPDVCNNGVTKFACQGTGGNYLGNTTTCAQCNTGSSAGQYCRRCSNNAALSCNVDADCGGGNTCIPTNSACDQSGPAALCVAEPSCAQGGCCNPTTGACTVELEGACVSPRNYLGNGTDCDADHGLADEGQQHSCPQPLASYTGADSCNNAIMHIITVPPIGETKVITITGNNSTATSTIATPDACFDPSDDPTLDPGWWEAFTLVDDCSIVYLDLCGTFPEHKPGWARIFDDCTATACGASLARAPNPYEFPEPAFSRGSPDSRCQDDDNLWFCTGLLRPGTYFWPIYSALAGHRGQYQAHISVRACPVAACCTQDQCVDNKTQFECDALGGVLLAPPQKSPAVTSCVGTNGQPGSTCYNGSCCTGPGECFDVQLTTPINKANCDTAQGNFVGNMKCRGGTCSNSPNISCINAAECPGGTCVGDAEALAQDSPCPICEFEGLDNCQAYDATSGNIAISDRGIAEGGFLVADDIQPVGDTLSSVCVWGSYIDSNPNAVVADCGPAVTSDHFRVRIFENDPATGRSPKPGAPLHVRNASMQKGLVPDPFANLSAYGFQLVLTDEATGLVDTPITGLTVGGIYWMEVSNAPEVPNNAQTDYVDGCAWFWSQRIPDSNSLSFAGTEDGYAADAAAPIEQSFCTDFSLTPSTIGDNTGPCCTCDGVCSVKSFFDCASSNGVWDITRTNCTTPVVSCPSSIPSNDTCDDNPASCTAVGVPYACCTGNGTGVCGGRDPITPGSYVVSNQCATTDGFGPIPSDFGLSQLDYDLWYEFVAPAPCDLVVSECLTGSVFDSMLAVYNNCPPGSPANCDKTICPPCPITPEISAATLAGVGQDESCTVIATGGPGIWRASLEMLRNAEAGECFLFRIGSFPGGRGTALLDIVCPGGTSGAPGPVAENGVNKTRFLSFVIPAATGETAIRIKLTSLHVVSPPYNIGATTPFTAFNGQSVYVGAPAVYVESASSQTQFYASLTQCTPHYRDWSTVGLLHVTGSAIVPSSTYHVEHLAAGCLGVEGSAACVSGGTNVSAQTEIKTTRWADVETPYAPGTAGQPDFGDISALVNKFKSALGAPIKARALIAGSDAFGNITTLNVDVGFGHISACVDAFRGTGYPAKMGKCTGAPTPPASGACTQTSDCTGNNGAGPCILYCP